MPLRPLTFSEILDGGFQAIRTNPRTMLGFAAVVLSITSLLSLLPQAWLASGIADKLTALQDSTDPAAALGASLDVILSSLVTTIPSALLVWLAVVVLNALLVVAVSGAVLGQKTSLEQLWRQVRRRVPAAIGLSLLTGLLLLTGSALAGAVLAGPGIWLATHDQPWIGVLLSVLGGVAALAATVLLSVRTALAGPVLLLEQAGVVTALRRSWRLVNGSFWRVLGILVVVGLMTYGVSVLIQLPFSGIAALVDSAFDNPLHAKFGPSLVSGAINAIGRTAAGSVLNPWQAAVVALLYIDLRMRREGLDLELIRAADAAPPS